MRLSEFASAKIEKGGSSSHSPGSRARKKHKRLDAICEDTYNRNRDSVEKESLDGNGGGGADADSEIRRSTRARRAPVLLDASPSPTRKRKKIDKNGGRLSGWRGKRNEERVKSCSPPGEEGLDDEEEGEESGWKSRLRSRGRNVGVGGKEKTGSPRGKRKLFEDFDGVEEDIKLEKGEVGGDEEGFEGGNSTVVKSKRPGRIKALNVSWDEGKEIESNDVKEIDDDRNKVEVLGDDDDDEEDLLDLEGRVDGGTDNGNASQLVEKRERENPNGVQLEEVCIGNGNEETVEQIGEFPEQLECKKEVENHVDTVEIGGIATSHLEGGCHDANDAPSVMLGDKPLEGGCHDGNDTPSVMLGDKPLEVENGMNANKPSRYSADKLGKSRIKEGRRCGLCGGATDGKPPKRLTYDMAESENDACSGSSASEEPNYDIWDGFGEEPGWLGRLLGPIIDRFGIAGTWVHQHCAVWSPEVYFAGLGCLKNVRAALCRGRALKCSRCGRRGATIGCRVDRCPKTYHLPCARAEGCIFDHRKFLIACTDHRHLFQPQGNQYLYRIKKMKAKKMKLEIRKMSNDAWRKDIEAEEKWLEGEDEEFLKRESKRLHRDILRIAPVYIGGSNSESGKAFQGWESVAGLQDVIRCMKEVVILPLLYPEFFTNLGITPPRGVLLHGYPGTGKTLVVRSLIGSCARGDKRIAYFARKGADCLGKYVGDAERQLRLLFQVAEKSQPSIIFFDEIDGLAPSRTRQQDQTHSSVVSTLLALMDGVKSRGSVVVIGATNRPDAVDPALRRPGRFDREIYFPLPSVKDRAAILSLHTQKWPKQVAGSLLNWIARNTAGFAGADLQALCTQAAIIGLKRNCPLQELLSAAGEKASDGHRAPLPAFAVEERDWLEALSRAPPPCSHREAGIAANDVTSSPLPAHLISCLLQPLSSLLVSLYLDERLWLPPPLSKAATMIKNVIVSALEKKNVPSDCWWTHVKNLLQEADVAKEIEGEFSHAGILIRDSTFAGSDVLNNGIDDGSENFKSSRMHDGYRSSLLRNTSYASGKNSGLRILIAGGPRSGQNHLASCLLHCFVGNIEIQKVDLATISQEGRGDVLQGLTQILMKCSCLSSCVIFMPRIDLWAIKTHHQVDKEECDDSSTYDETSGKESGSEDDQVLEMVDESCETACDLVDNATPDDAVINADASSVSACDVEENVTPEDVVMTASHAWSSFMEQVDSIYVSTSLMILATSEVPFQELPIEIRKFFNRDISKCTDSTPEYTVPRFSVQADGNFNQDVVIISSAAKLSRDVVQQFVELIHHGTLHSTRSCGEYKTCNTFETDADVVCHDTRHASANHDEVVSKLSEDSLVKVPLPHYNRQLKGKSSLLLAISTFGSQILGYPHFAELCWVTSKLKDGPCSDINGPWKGWPFNTCVIRPNNSLEQVAVASGSSNMKNKEKSGVVRGLVAVGLSAYRGVYTSLREVSLEIRKVLKLLVENINAKIQAGKDKYQFVCILSQVAYLEDVVNSWAYTLQSLEQDAHLMLANPLTSTLRSPHDHNVCSDKQVFCEECKLDVSNRSSHKLEMVEESPRKFAAENNKSVELKDENGSLSCPSPNGRVAMPEEGSPQQMVLIHSDINTHLQNYSAAADGLGVKILNEKNETNAESENTGNHMVENGFGSLKYSNGFALTESAAISEHGPYSSGEAVGLGISSSVKVCNQVNGFSLIETDFQNDGGHSIPDAPAVSSEKITSLPVCLYSCCTECLYTLHGLMQKILLHEWGLHGICKTVEDVHDVVASLSMNLLSALRKDYVAESCRNSFDKKLSCENHGKLFEIQDIGTCQCESSENKLVTPMNCSCHSMNESCTDSVNTSPIPQLGLDTKFIYRDGVLAPVDLEKDVSFHCKFETLCLCSLIKWIAMTKKSLD